VEEALINSENKYRNIFENATEGIFQSTPEGRYISINPAFAKIGGYNSPDEMMESVTNIKKIYVHQEDRTRLLELLNKHNIVTNFEAEIRRRDNAIIWISMNVRVIRDRDHRIIFLEGTIQDITDRKRAEKALHESEDRYRSLYVDSRDAIMILSPERGFIAGNPAAVKLFACRDEQEFNKLSPELLSPEYQPDGVRSLDRSLEMIRLVLEKGSHFFEWTHRRADGTDFSATVLLSRIERSESQLIQATVRDITERKQAEEKLKDTLESLRKAVNTTIQVMVSAVEVRDPYTAGHQLRSADLARAIATEMGLPQKKVDGIRMAGSIHDIGKLSIPAEILSKPIKLTNLEFSLIKEHSRSGYEMLKDVESPWPLAEIVYQHHERMDGSGYPRNLKGDDILMEARIMAVADVVEAMASHRPYRAGLGIDAALSEIEKNRGIFYDDAVADACLRLFREKGYQLS
jgi:PAS domain S-box-containing protein